MSVQAASTVKASTAHPAAITADRLRLFAPHCDAALITPQLDNAARLHGIATVREVRHWLANLHNESQGFTVCSEDLRYSAEELCKTFPDHFANLSVANSCAGNPVAIGCRIYAKRMGNNQAMDGYTYRGRGWLQITGRDTYEQAGKRLGRPYVDQPDLVAQPRDAALTAADFWQRHDCDAALAGHADDHNAAEAVRRIVNGGLIGFPNVWAQFERTGQIWRD